MNNIIECKLESTYKEIFIGLWQYDYGQILRITGVEFPKAVEIQFSLNEKSGSTITRIGTTVDGATEVQIPNELLKNDGRTYDYCIYAYIYLTDETSGSTEYEIVLRVKSRTKPENPSEEPLPEPNIFHETVAAVNASAERAEKALEDVEEIRDNLNLDLSEKITRPDTAKVGQVLAVKEINESGKPTVFEAEDVKVPTKTSELENDSGFLTEHQDISGKLDKDKLPEAIDDALAQAKESGEFNGKDGAPGEKGDKGDPGETTYIENPYDDTKIKEEIAAKVGYSEVVGNQLLMYADDTKKKLLATLELPSGVEDVQINGESIVQDGIAEIPLCTKIKGPGLITVDLYSSDGGLYRVNNDTGLIRIAKANNMSLTERENEFCPVVPANLDYAVKAAMCDGKGAAWTAEEQAAARERMGALDTQDMIDITEITMDAETLKYVFPSFADYRILEISFLKTYKATTGLTGIIWLRIANMVGWSIFPSYAYNTFTLDASGKSCIGKSIRTNNAQIETNINGLAVDKKYWNTEFREAPYLLLSNAELAQYYAECNTVIKVRGIKR